MNTHAPILRRCWQTDRPGVRLGAPDWPTVAGPRSPLFWVEDGVATGAPGICGPRSVVQRLGA